jgi:hypothetical protein
MKRVALQFSTVARLVVRLASYIFAQRLVLRPSFGGVISIGISQVPLNALASLHLPFWMRFISRLTGIAPMANRPHFLSYVNQKRKSRNGARLPCEMTGVKIVEMIGLKVKTGPVSRHNIREPLYILLRPLALGSLARLLVLSPIALMLPYGS